MEIDLRHGVRRRAIRNRSLKYLKGIMMNFNNTTLALALSGVLFFTLPMTSVFANQATCELSASQPENVIKQIKSELKGYVKGVKSDAQTTMQTHVNTLLILSETANQSMAGMDHSNMAGMDHSQMQGMDHSNMAGIDHSNMKGMDHSKMTGIDHSNMKGMDHSKMNEEVHQQHMSYMTGMLQLQQQFEALNQTMDKTEIKAILLEIKGSLEMVGTQSSLHCS